MNIEIRDKKERAPDTGGASFPSSGNVVVGDSDIRDPLATVEECEEEPLEITFDQFGQVYSSEKAGGDMKWGQQYEVGGS